MSGINLNFNGAVGQPVIQASRGLFSLEAVGNSFTLSNPPPPTETIHWNPGDYLLSAGFLNATPNPTEFGDLSAAISSSTNWIGYAIFCAWGQLEGSLGDYSGGFSAVDAMLVSLAAMTPRQGHLVLQINLGAFFSAEPVGGGSVPTYLLTNATYGAAIPGNSGQSTGTYPYGWYATGPSNYGANIYTNSAVQARVQALANAYGARYNSNPLFEGIQLCAWDSTSPTPTSGITDAQYFGTQSNPAVAGRELALSYFRTAFPNCNVWEQSGWENSNTGNVTNPQLHMDWCIRNGFMPSSSDVLGYSGWAGTYEPISDFTNSGASFASITGGGTTGNLNATTWYCTSGTYLLQFTSTGQTVSATLTQGGSTCTFSPAVTGSPTLSAVTMAFGPNRLDIGQYTWFGMQYPGSSYTPPATPLQTLAQGGQQCQSDDISISPGFQAYPTVCSPADICVSYNNTGNQGYKASHRFWTHLTSGQNPHGPPWATWGSGLSYGLPLAPNANLAANTGYPSIYTTLYP